MLAVVAILAAAGAVVALHPALRPGWHLGSHHDAAPPAVDSAPSSDSTDPSDSTTSPPSTDDSFGTSAKLPPVPTGTDYLTIGGDGGHAITPDEAGTLFMGLWSAREDALSTSRLSELKQVEDGVALSSDTNALTCRCVSYGVVKPQDVSVIVPQAAKYPAYFVAEMAADSPDEDLFYLLVITRASAASSWHITLESGFSTDESMVGELDASGWAGDAGRPLGSDGHGIAELASLWQQAKTTGKSVDAGAFDASSWLATDEVDLLAKYPQGKPQANGLSGKVSFVADPGVPTFAVEASGEDIACGAIRETDTYTPARGHAISQDPGQRAFGAALPPGLYSSVTETRDWQICIFGFVGSPSMPIGWDPVYRAAVSGVPVEQGRSVSPDPAQRLETPDGGSDNGSDGGPDGSSGSNT